MGHRLRDDNVMRRLLIGLLRENSGQDLAEFALLLMMVALAAVGTISTLSDALNDAYGQAAECHARARAEQARACEDRGRREPQK